ncbi:putative component of NuA3 histone acetyltransferase complex [Coemansia guatemalensis]|uniref:Component of NuA3 histone acetyltransferase complex n=1 Tax=Coemansia guatemalensis TaxID=2761395 RepID=A0A9W8HZW8_9FUNG|nr:putative component of NuA3 histone acetyltransferase complex [Coemansia guatemalensis]
MGESKVEAEYPAEKRARKGIDNDAAAGTRRLQLNSGYLDEQFIKEFHAAFTEPNDKQTLHTIDLPNNKGRGEVVSSPFHTGRLQHILPAKFLHELKTELTELDWHERSNDLYWFHQTDDLALNGRQHIKELRDYLSGEEFVGFMEQITGVQLTRGYLDLAAQRYKQGNHLLCHDDDVQRGKLTRKIAYIIYLVDEDWTTKDGGALGLFATDASGYPTEVAARIVPEFNSIGFFLTGHASFHTVEEVTVADADRERWSVTGWFYGPVGDAESEPKAPPPLPSSILPELLPLVDFDAEDAVLWERWINSDYLSANVQTKIQATFLEQSSVELRDFLRPEVYSNFIATLTPELWATSNQRGPAHVSKYLETPATGDLALFLRSASFARFLTQLTSLDYSNVSQQIRKFEKGHYTLINDQALEPCGLDATLFLGSALETDNVPWDVSWGGATHYIADKDELLRIVPQPNSLALVLRDEGTLRFVKYLNFMAQQRSRQDISMTFIETDASQ